MGIAISVIVIVALILLGAIFFAKRRGRSVPTFITTKRESLFYKYPSSCVIQFSTELLMCRKHVDIIYVYHELALILVSGCFEPVV